MTQPTLVVNLCGGPYSRKSTTMGGVFSKLKRRGVNCEMAPEFAKDLVWQKSTHLLANQIYVFGVQHYRIHHLLGQVDVIITDGPLLHSVIYGEHYDTPTFRELVWEEHNKLNNLNFFLRRGDHDFLQAGRIHDKDESQAIDLQVQRVLEEAGGYTTVSSELAGEEEIVRIILETLCLGSS